jgi:hypothetical protein
VASGVRVRGAVGLGARAPRRARLKFASDLDLP